MLRSIGALLAGAAAIAGTVIAGTMLAAALLAGADGSVTGPYLAANLGLSFGAAVLGGWLVARLAPRRPRLHAALLGGLMLLLSAPGLGTPAPGQPVWYPAVLLFIGLGGVACGALLHLREGGARARSVRSSHA